MKRNLKLLADILFSIESQETEAFMGNFNFGATYSYAQISYHIRLLEQAGFITTESFEKKPEKYIETIETRLTWQGHDYLDKVRSHFFDQG